LRYNGTTGAFIDTFASGSGLSGPAGLAFGPDGNLYVGSFNSDAVLRYNGTTGAFIDTFASGSGLSGPVGLLFGSDGNLYVGSNGSNGVLRYDGTTGAFVDTFVTAGSGGLNGPSYVVPIPEPETYAMMLAGLGLLGFAARRRKHNEAAGA